MDEVSEVGADFEDFEYAGLSEHAGAAAIGAADAFADVERGTLRRELVQSEESDLFVGEGRFFLAIWADFSNEPLGDASDEARRE